MGHYGEKPLYTKLTVLQGTPLHLHGGPRPRRRRRSLHSAEASVGPSRKRAERPPLVAPCPMRYEPEG